MVFLHFLMLYISIVTVSLECQIYHHCPLLLLVNYHCIWLVKQQLLEFPQDINFALNHFQWCVPLGLEDLTFILGTDVT